MRTNLRTNRQIVVANLGVNRQTVVANLRVNRQIVVANLRVNRQIVVANLTVNRQILGLLKFRIWEYFGKDIHESVGNIPMHAIFTSETLKTKPHGLDDK